MSVGNGDLPKPDVETGNGTPPTMGNKEIKEATRKIIRVLTVLAYLSSVSMAAFMLSLYYIFLWNPAPHLSPGARIMPSQPISSLDYSTTSSSSTDRMVNRTWEGPEEPRALPVQIAEPPQLREQDLAHLHSNDAAGTWDDPQPYDHKRKRSAKEVIQLLKIKDLT